MPLSAVADPPLEIVIPALNARRHLRATLAAIEPGRRLRLVRGVTLVDGGSTDGTPELATALDVRVMSAPRGRGQQLRAGGEAAAAPWLLFLHADTQLASGWVEAVRAFVEGSSEVAADRAATFRLRLDDEAAAARCLEYLVAWRTRVFGLPYGDQGLLIPTAMYRSLGGYAPIPLMEDVELARRLGRRRIVLLEAEALTSAERYRRSGYTLRSLRNLFVLALYLCGVPPERLTHLYG